MWREIGADRVHPNPAARIAWRPILPAYRIRLILFLLFIFLIARRWREPSKPLDSKASVKGYQWEQLKLTKLQFSRFKWLAMQIAGRQWLTVYGELSKFQWEFDPPWH